MGRKCSVAQCRTGYAKVRADDPQQKVSVYGFPYNEEERKEWLLRIPNKFDTVTPNMGVCALHWPADTVLVHKRPVVPPTIFSLSSYSHPCSRVRRPPRCKTKQKTLSGNQSAAVIKHTSYDEGERLKPETFVDDFKKRFLAAGLFASNEDNVAIFSHERTGSIHTFSIYVSLHERTKPNMFFLCYEAYRGLKQILHPFVTNPLKYWSELEEVISFLQSGSPSENDSQPKVISTISTGQESLKNNSPESLPIAMIEDSTLASSGSISSESPCKEMRTHSALIPLLTSKGIQYGTVVKIVTKGDTQLKCHKI